jgi:hypothetical protein
MNLNDVFDQLVYGELSKSYMGENGEVSTKDYNRLITHINLGLTELHKRFDLKRKSVNVTVIDAVYDYEINQSKDVIEVLQVVNGEGVDIPINAVQAVSSLEEAAHYKDTESVFIPNSDHIVVNKGMKPQVLTVFYRANHPVITKVLVADLARFDPKTVDIDLPFTYLDALLYFIGSRLFTAEGVTSINGRAPFNAGNNYAAKFEAACNLLVREGLDISESVNKNKFSMRGFV